MSKSIIIPNEQIKKNRNDVSRPRMLYSKNVIGAVLYGSILNYLSNEEITRLNIKVLIDSRISVPPLKRFIIENYITLLKSNQKNPDDCIICKNLVFNDKVKTKDLIKKHFHKNIGGNINDILQRLNIKISTPRKFRQSSNQFHMS